MRQVKVFVIVLLTFYLTGCNRKVSGNSMGGNNGVEETTPVAPPRNLADTGIVAPPCIAKKIDSLKHMPAWNPPAEIHEYEYNGSRVYATTAPCCDLFNTVTDAACNYICAPSGGFTGKGDMRCPGFFKDARHLRLVWKDDRTKP